MNHLERGHLAAPNLRSCRPHYQGCPANPKVCGTSLTFTVPSLSIMDSPSWETEVLGKEDTARTHHPVLQGLD